MVTPYIASIRRRQACERRVSDAVLATGLGGLQPPPARGGRARAEALTGAQRTEIATKAANTRWKRETPSE